ncbi:response regulator transcription factor [Cupriavidus necator]|uniref:response regulator transcription factor n=1 Tax=Cupriavidus necator TaxID=106590 RepID=UPI0005B413BC|nr:response regulator [Cupriavidus necator]
MESVNQSVCVVDDDASIREALTSLLRAHGKSVLSFNSGKQFLESIQWDTVACLILDMRMPGMTGLEVQEHVINSSQVSIVFITGRNDVPSTVRAMKSGAVDFLAKPISEDALLRAVDMAIARTHSQRINAAADAALRALYETLTPREQELLPLLVGGLLNKQAADVLGITEYTVQVHRGHIMKKMQARSFATLVRQASRLELETCMPSNCHQH